MPSLDHMYAKTTATSAPFAAAAAAAGSVPGSYLTVALGARAWIALSGEVGNQISSSQWVAPLPSGMMALPPMGSTCAEPPPEIMPTSECDPITAIVRSLDGFNGNVAC